MIRYNILDGDTTTARGGGIVIGSARHITNRGRAVALIGDDVICRECGTTGKICSNGPRLVGLAGARGAALSGDLCRCNCSPPPKLINSRTDLIQDTHTSEVVRQGVGSGVEVTHSHYDCVFAIKNNQTGLPLSGIKYRMTLPDGTVVEGEADEQGMTQRIASKARHDVTIELPV